MFGKLVDFFAAPQRLRDAQLRMIFEQYRRDYLASLDLDKMAQDAVEGRK